MSLDSFQMENSIRNFVLYFKAVDKTRRIWIVHFMVAELTRLDSVNLELDKHPTPDQVRRCFQDAPRSDPLRSVC